MSKGMLGNLALSDVWGPLGQLVARLAGDEGPEWLEALKKFLRKENPWQSAGYKAFLSLWVENSDGQHILGAHKGNVRLPFVPSPGMYFELFSGGGDNIVVQWVMYQAEPHTPLDDGTLWIHLSGTTTEAENPDDLDRRLIEAGWDV